MKKYYLISIIILLVIFFLFFMSFERKRPKAKDVVTLGVMIAIAVAARAAFIYVPHFKPMAAIIMIVGVAFGPYEGFLVGACSALMSNFIFGQGFWTPWQMVAFGVSGLLAGIVFNRLNAPKNRFIFAIFGMIEIVAVTGPILDTSSVFFMLSEQSEMGIAAIYASGFPVNLVHGTATAITMFLLAVPLIKRLDRIKKKYGIMEKGKNGI